MLLTIHDANLKKVAFIDNDKQETLNYYDDTWTRSLETGSSTFEFTVYKKAIKSDTAINKTYNLLNERAFVSFRHNGKSYVFNVMTVEENEQTIKCYCENLNLELINEYANPYKATKAMSFVEYCNAMDLLNFTHLSVGINEISDQKRTLEWDGQDTKLARLLSLAKKFDAEIDFDTYLNADSSIKAFKVNVYHENDDNHQGVGRVRNDIQLTYGKNLKSIKRKIDKTGIYTMIRPTGKGKTKNAKGEEVETVVTIGGLGTWSENNADGVREFYQSGEALYAPLAAQMYPSTFTSGTQKDQWIRKDLVVESDNPTVIRAAAIRDLKKNAYPAITYDVDGFIDVEVGDTVKIYDDGFSPILLVEARVSDQKISFTNPSSNKTTFANFKALENNLSDGIQAAFERLFEASKPYLIKLSTDNGVIFKNQIGQSLVTPSLYRGGKPVVSGVTWRWSLDGNTTTGMTYLVQGSSVTDTATLTVAAYIGNDEVAVDEISFVNVLDGTMGTPGKPGQDGRTPYVHTAWANNETGTSGFSLDSSINKLYIGIYTDFEPADSQDSKKYKWTKIKGDKGDKGDPGQRGLDGLQGEKGEQGIPGEKGADGRTQYTHIAYADNATGGGFSQTDQNKAYIGMYQDFNATDSTNPTSYRWTKWKGSDGAQGIPGPKGADGRTPYVHFAYSDNADGAGLTTSDNGQRYIGHYSDYTQADSTDKTKYRWADRWAKIEVGGINLLTDTDEETVYISKDPAAMEFLRTPYDLAKVFDRYGLATYTLSFDLKADKAGAVHVYMQNGSGSRYGGLHADIGVTTEWKRYHVTFTPTEGNMELSESFLAFYGVYGTGVVPYARKFQLEKGTVPTDYGPKPNSMRVGGRNYLRNSSFVDGVSYWQNNSGAEQFSWRSVPEFATQLGRKGCIHLYSNGLPLDSLGIFQVIQDMQLSEQEKITLSFDVVGREGNDSGLMVIINNHLFDVRQIIPVSSIRTYSQFTKTSLERKALTFTIPKACDAISVIIIFHGGITGDVILTDLMLERGVVATSHQESPSDIADRIGVKADQALTQEQLNLLNERAQILDAELKAKASMDALSDLEKAYQSFVKSNADRRAKAEADLAEAGRRIELLVTQFGGFKELKTFIDTYMSSSNEGLIIGKNDASSTIKVSSDRISMFSAGKEVMYISQGVIHIDNGIFTASVQIGKFRTEQYHLNADMNVVRYVG
ncbi:phage tail spike protein [Streptococcus suis]|uniref:phage tail spike protein n=1 Tax=Streptococcus suis TaxID=1307 RepID=UPI001EF980DF|nr:phage tail spike protein [Streptococcus suis]